MPSNTPTQLTTTTQENTEPPDNRHRGPKVRCAVCLKLFSRLTDDHLRSHGYSAAQYKRVFVSPLRPSPAPPRIGSDPLARAAALVNDPAFVPGIADQLMHGPLRDRLTLSVTALLEVRSRIHGNAVARLEAINAELSAEWRIKHGGPNGKETSTKDLLLMAQTAQSEVRSTEELFMRAAKLAVDEMKGSDKLQANLPGGLDHYTGSAEKLSPVPADLTSAERENVRQLLTALPNILARRRARLAAQPIDATARVVDGSPQAPCAQPMATIGPERPSMEVIRERVRAMTTPPAQAPCAPSAPPALPNPSSDAVRSAMLDF
jgi:hypothetical protein